MTARKVKKAKQVETIVITRLLRKLREVQTSVKSQPLGQLVLFLGTIWILYLHDSPYLAIVTATGLFLGHNRMQLFLWHSLVLVLQPAWAPLPPQIEFRLSLLLSLYLRYVPHVRRYMLWLFFTLALFIITSVVCHPLVDITVIGSLQYFVRNKLKRYKLWQNLDIFPWLVMALAPSVIQQGLTLYRLCGVVAIFHSLHPSREDFDSKQYLATVGLGVLTLLCVSWESTLGIYCLMSLFILTLFLHMVVPYVTDSLPVGILEKFAKNYNLF